MSWTWRLLVLSLFLGMGLNQMDDFDTDEFDRLMQDVGSGRNGAVSSDESLDIGGNSAADPPDSTADQNNETVNQTGESYFLKLPTLGKIVYILRNGVWHLQTRGELLTNLHRTKYEMELLQLEREHDILEAYEKLRHIYPDLPPPDPDDYPDIDISRNRSYVYPGVGIQPNGTSSQASPFTRSQLAELMKRLLPAARDWIQNLPHPSENLPPASSGRSSDASDINSDEEIYDKSRRTHEPEIPDDAAPEEDGEHSEDSPEQNDRHELPEAFGELGGERTGRRRRFVERKESKRWTKGIVPFIFTKTIKEDRKPKLTASMRRIERYTCIRFVPWEYGKTRRRYKLDHDGHLNFIVGKGCWSFQGNSRSDRGQPISCCGGITCIHELGHALGLGHEQNSPDRDDYTRVNWENIKPDSARWYGKGSYERYIVYQYNPGSLMGYGPGMFNMNGRPTMNNFEPVMLFGQNFFYFFSDISKSHDCAGLRCPNFKKTCHNDGYVTVENNICKCACPEGLDPITGCTTIEKVNTYQPKTWPSGSYALPATVYGCPGTHEFNKGSRIHRTEAGSKLGPLSHLGGSASDRRITIEFCVKTKNVPLSGVKAKWTPGKYCIQRKGGKCPQGFKEGYMQFDDVASSSARGPQPDGVFTDNSRYEFCCRDDGSTGEPLLVPNDKPFILYRKVYHDHCQKVDGMHAIEEYFVFDNSRNDRVASVFGSAPKPKKGPNLKYYIFYCFYIPLRRNCGRVIELSKNKPSVTFASPNYPRTYPDLADCYWVIKGPPNSRLILNFNDFEVESEEELCPDYVQVYASRLGSLPLEFCGDGFQGGVLTVFNTLKVHFRTNERNGMKGFLATVKLALDEDLCYLPEDNGASYRGTVSRSMSGRPCLPWVSVTNCRHNTFTNREDDHGLESNYCRNPGNGKRPWCYTQAENCEREYCDVCSLVKSRDQLEDCPQLAREGYCDAYPDLAMGGCARTCSASFPKQTPIKVATVTCPPPKGTPDANIISQMKGFFRVGDKVRYKCKTGHEIVTRTCLTSGDWTNMGYVCGGCASGWTSLNGFCYKYFKNSMDAFSAREVCRNYNGILSPAKTEEEKLLLADLREQQKPILIGLNDEEEEGKWMWDDGTPAFGLHWKKGQPDNRYNEDCAIMNADFLNFAVADVHCGSLPDRKPFVCKSTPSARRVCADRRTDCQRLLHFIPTMCSEERDFAFTQCPFSCRLCSRGNFRRPPLWRGKRTFFEEPEDNQRCRVPQPPTNGISMTHVIQMGRGEAVIHKCNLGYVSVFGNLERACLANGQLTGRGAVCKDMETVDTELNQVELIDRTTTGEAGYSYTGNNDNFRLDRGGQISEWRFYSRKSRSLALQIWRPKDEFGSATFEFVGQNLVTSKENRVNIVTLPRGSRLTVQAGDFIGIWYGPGDGGIPYDVCETMKRISASPVVKLTAPVNDPVEFHVSYPSKFRTEADCFAFSIQATISPVGKQVH